MYMTGFMKTASIICTKSHIFHLDFTPPKCCLTNVKEKKIRKDGNKRKINEWRGKKTDFSLMFILSTMVKKKRPGLGTSSLTMFS